MTRERYFKHEGKVLIQRVISTIKQDLIERLVIYFRFYPEKVNGKEGASCC
jgi:hypothetical protein